MLFSIEKRPRDGMFLYNRKSSEKKVLYGGCFNLWHRQSDLWVVCMPGLTFTGKWMTNFIMLIGESYTRNVNIFTKMFLFTDVSCIWTIMQIQTCVERNLTAALATYWILPQVVSACSCAYKIRAKFEFW